MCTDKKISKPIILGGILKTEKDIATILMVLKSMKSDYYRYRYVVKLWLKSEQVDFSWAWKGLKSKKSYFPSS